MSSKIEFKYILSNETLDSCMHLCYVCHWFDIFFVYSLWPQYGMCISYLYLSNKLLKHVRVSNASYII